VSTQSAPPCPALVVTSLTKHSFTGRLDYPSCPSWLRCLLRRRLRPCPKGSCDTHLLCRDRQWRYHHYARRRGRLPSHLPGLQAVSDDLLPKIPHRRMAAMASAGLRLFLLLHLCGWYLPGYLPVRSACQHHAQTCDRPMCQAGSLHRAVVCPRHPVSGNGLGLRLVANRNTISFQPQSRSKDFLLLSIATRLRWLCSRYCANSNDWRLLTPPRIP